MINEQSILAKLIGLDEVFTQSAEVKDLLKRDLSKGQSIGLLLRIAQTNNHLEKIISLLGVLLKLFYIKCLAILGRFEINASYGIYPNLDEPVAIIQLNSASAEYMYENVLPEFPPGLNGVIRKIILNSTGIHPALAGVVVVLEVV